MPPHTRRFQPLSSSVSVPACVSVSVPVAMPVADALPRPGALSDARRPVAIPRISSTELKAALSRFLGALSRVQVRLSEVDWDEARDGREGAEALGQSLDLDHGRRGKNSIEIALEKSARASKARIVKGWL